MLKITPETPTESNLLERYGVATVLRYRAILSKPERGQKRRTGRAKPWFSESPNLTQGMKETIREQFSQGRSVLSIAARWAIPTAIVRDVLGLPQISPRRR